ncbi:glutamate synthase-related protein [Carboxydocella sp. JDF658]|uniref:glutamate synthase-related protein n=1 Tax=Carboxydocella sp. JDF658 TaxID=1926600 RepID=UPI0009AD076D|nr:glutamate synthase-related protein [Carboxydocella sp. JDF658]
MKSIAAEFRVVIEHDRCRRCQRCVRECSFGALSWQDRVVAKHRDCVACRRCMFVCPEDCIYITQNPAVFKENAHWQPRVINNVKKQAATGAKLLTATGNDKPWKNYFDHIALDACQVTNPSLDPLREPMELRTYLGSRPDGIKVVEGPGGYRLAEPLPPQIKLETPLVFAAMSFGAISLNAHRALAKAAAAAGILYNTGEGGLHPELYQYGQNTIVQVASGRFGVTPEYLNQAAMVEIKVGQGAKPGIGGHLPGEKVDGEVSRTRMIPVGSDAISPAPHHDIYSIEDLAQLITAIKEATNYSKPVAVKIAAVHNVAAIASGIARAGADVITIDGFRGGTGATPAMIRDHVGIPIELALAAVDDRLRQEGIRNRVSIIAGGGIRHSADVVKALALGADAVMIGTAALIALGCTMCQKCYSGRCAWGIATQDPNLTRRLDPEWGAEQLTNLIRGWSLEIKEILGAMGVNAVESLRGSRERLRAVGLTAEEMEILGLKHAGR